MNVITLRRPEALGIPDIQDLLRRALDSTHMVAPNGLDTVAQDVINLVTMDDQFLFLGAEKGKFHAVMMGYLPVGNMFPYPTVVLIYNEGSRALSRAMQEHLLDFITSRGYTRMLAVNTSGHRDEAWLRGLTPAGATSEIIGSLALFEVD